MSRQQAGSDLDNKIANAINEATTDKVAAHSMRGSGNTGYAEVFTPTESRPRSSRTPTSQQATNCA